MVSVEKIYDTFLHHGVDFFTGVPDSLLKNICAYITDHAPRGRPPMKVPRWALPAVIIWLLATFLWFICRTPVWEIR